MTPDGIRRPLFLWAAENFLCGNVASHAALRVLFNFSAIKVYIMHLEYAHNGLVIAIRLACHWFFKTLSLMYQSVICHQQGKYFIRNHHRASHLFVLNWYNVCLKGAAVPIQFLIQKVYCSCKKFISVQMDGKKTHISLVWEKLRAGNIPHTLKQTKRVSDCDAHFRGQIVSNCFRKGSKS